MGCSLYLKRIFLVWLHECDALKMVGSCTVPVLLGVCGKWCGPSSFTWGNRLIESSARTSKPCGLIGTRAKACGRGIGVAS